MKIERAKLLSALEKVKIGLSSKETIEQMTMYNFLGNYLVTFNDMYSVFFPLETDFVCSVKADTFREVVLKDDDKTINLTLDDTLKYQTKTVQADFPISLSTDLKEMIADLEKQISGDYKPIPEDFITGAYLCMFSASKDPASEALTCLDVEGSDLFCCDSFRASWYTMKSPMDSFLVKPTIGRELKGYVFKEYKLSDSWLHLKDEAGAVFNVRTVKGTYLNLRDFFNLKGVKIKVPVELKVAVDVAGIATRMDSLLERSVKISIINNIASCESTKQGGLMIKKDVPIPFYEGSDLAFTINPDFLLEVIERSKAENTGMTLDFEKNKAGFSDQTFRHILGLKKM